MPTDGREGPPAAPPPGRSAALSRQYRRRRLVVLAAVVVVVVGAVVLLQSSPPSTPRRQAAPSTTTTVATTATTSLGPDGMVSPAVVAENQRPGTTAWEIEGTPPGMIEGFAGLNYAAVGQTVPLYVSTDAPQFRVVAYRMGYYQGRGARAVWTSPETVGKVQPACPVTPDVNMVGCDNWSASLSVPITSAFVPGDYLLKLDGSAGQQSYVLLTVWNPKSHSAYLIMNRSFVEQGWNDYGGYSYYTGKGPCPPGWGDSYPVCNRARIVSFDRPYAEGNGSSDFLSNEYPLVSYCEQHGLDVSYVTDLTVDEHPTVLLHHRTLLGLDHDETWTNSERTAALTAQARGVNIAFFGAATLVRHARLQRSPLGPDREEVDYRNSSEDPLNGVGDPMEVTGNTWASPPTNWSAAPFLGEYYSGYMEPNTPPVAFVVWDAADWIFKGTGLRNGSAVPGIIESDFDHLAPDSETPANLQVLGHSPVPLSSSYTNQGEWGQYTYSDMTYYTDPTSKAGVLDTGDNNWVNALTPCPVSVPDCAATAVGQITGNVLRLFGQGPAGATEPSVANWRQVTPPGS